MWLKLLERTKLMSEKIEDDQAEATKIGDREGLIKSELVDPVIVAGYAATLPGSEDRILKMIEGQVRHRQFIEKLDATSKCLRSLLGVVFAFIVALLCLGAGFLVFLLTNSIAAGAGAGVFFGFTTLGLVRRFIYGTKNN